jgi:hypothetical protein
VWLLESLPRQSEYDYGDHGRKLDDEHVCISFRVAAGRVDFKNKRDRQSLRPTCATWLVQRAVGICAVGINNEQKVMGHSSAAVTQVYAHLARRAARCDGQDSSVTEMRKVIPQPSTLTVATETKGRSVLLHQVVGRLIPLIQPLVEGKALQ